MVSIREETLIPSPPDKVWPLLSDPAVVAACIPGAELSPDAGDGKWRGSIRVKFGPTVAAFRGEAALDFDDATRTCVMQGRGIDQRGASRALASGKLVVTGETETTLAIDGEFNVTGPLEAFANSGGVHVARALLGEFAANLAKVVEEDGAARPAPEAAADAAPSTAAAGAPASPPPQSTPRPAAKEINAFALAWKVLKSMIAGMFGRKGRS